MEFFSNLFNNQTNNNNNNNNNNNSNITNYIIKPKSKILPINQSLSNQTKIIKNNLNYNISLQIHGNSIFSNLVLTASATPLNSTTQLPIKCIWKRVHNSTVIFIKDINSFSYMPNAMDIGYLIEVEVSLLENPNENCIIQYGPIEMDKDIKNAIEILLTNGSTKFNLNVFDKIKQEKIYNKELILYLNNNELKLVDIDFNHNETILEKVKYNFFNPNVKLNSTNQNRFNLTFFEFDSNFKNENIEINNNINIKEKIKSEYELIAMSKQNRELIYLIIQFFIIDEKIKNNKIFSMVNYSSFDYETKIGITELIGELKIIKEENNIYMKNMKILKNENLRLNKNLKDLEEDFHITMKNINDNNNFNSNFNNLNNNFNNLNNNFNNNLNNNLNKNVSLLTENDNYKIKFNDLNDLYNSLIAKEKALNEEKNELNKKNENLNKINNNNSKLISDLKEKNSNLENDIEIINKNYNTINEENKKLKNDLKLNENKIKILEENLNNLKNDLKKFNNNENNINKETLEKLTFENKNLIQQRNMLSNQKSDYKNQIEKLKNENSKLILESKNSKEKFDNLNNKFNKLNEEFNLLNENKLILENDNKTLKEINNNLNNIINNNNKNININNSYSSINIKITPEEYEEYDNLRKEKDENDAIILQLKSNNNAKDLEIENLKKIIESYKK